MGMGMGMGMGVCVSGVVYMHGWEWSEESFIFVLSHRAIIQTKKQID